MIKETLGNSLQNVKVLVIGFLPHEVEFLLQDRISSPRPSFEYKHQKAHSRLEVVDFSPNIPRPEYSSRDSSSNSLTHSQMMNKPNEPT